jgi:thiol:disulfide interchange protein DsbD
MLNQFKIFSFLVYLFTVNSFYLQENPVKWEIVQNKEKQQLEFSASIESSWHLYAVNLPNPNEGPLPTEFVFHETEGFKRIGDIIENDPISVFDDSFGVQVSYFEKTATFIQKIKVIENNYLLKIQIAYMVCNEEMCIPFDDSFELILEI